MQHNLVLTTSFALQPGAAVTSAEDQYEFDVTECLHRLRYGRILALTAGWPGLGRSAGIAEEIVRMIMIYGRVKVRDVGGYLAEGENASSRESSLPTSNVR
jgi:DNA-directed RNA polymerase III subunit RPC3